MTRRNKTAATILAAFVVALWSFAASAFCTVAGNCEPTPAGTLTVTYLGDGDEATPATFSLYPAGEPASHRTVVLTAPTGNPVEVLTGAYDVKVHGSPPLWARGVLIEQNKTASVELGGVGALLVSGNDSTGKPVQTGVILYIAGAERSSGNIVASGKTNEPLQVVAGTYDVRAQLEPDVWFESVPITMGKTAELQLPAPTVLQFVVADPDGKPLDDYVFIQGLGDEADVRATKKTNTEISMFPGRYDIRVALNPNVWFRDLEVMPGQTINLQIAQRGRLLVRMPGTGTDISRRFWVRTQDEKKDTVVTGIANTPVAIGPGTYSVDVKISDNWQIIPVTIEPGKTATIDVPAN